MSYRGPVAEIGVIGGSGFYSFFDDAQEVEVETPFGAPSGPLTIGTVAGRRVAFLPRHGVRHQFPPHRVNYRANLWALRTVGVQQVLGPCAVGSLRAELGPGSLVVPDQFVDRTWGRAHTFYDAKGPVVHVGFADPYCPRAGPPSLTDAAAADWPPADGGTLVVSTGRGSPPGPSRSGIRVGLDRRRHDRSPEASLARELALCYTAISLSPTSTPDSSPARASPTPRCSGCSPQHGKAARCCATCRRLPAAPDCACRHALDGRRCPSNFRDRARAGRRSGWLRELRRAARAAPAARRRSAVWRPRSGCKPPPATAGHRVRARRDPRSAGRAPVGARRPQVVGSWRRVGPARRLSRHDASTASQRRSGAAG